MIKVGDRIKYNREFFKKMSMKYPKLKDVDGLVIYIRGEQVYYLSQNSIKIYGWDYIDYLETINDLEVV
jgi:hypothetical protein